MVTMTAFSFNSHSSIVEAQRLISLEHFLSHCLDSGSQEGVYYTFQPSTIKQSQIQALKFTTDMK